MRGRCHNARHKIRNRRIFGTDGFFGKDQIPAAGQVLAGEEGYILGTRDAEERGAGIHFLQERPGKANADRSLIGTSRFQNHVWSYNTGVWSGQIILYHLVLTE